MKSYTSERGKPAVQNPVDIDFEYDGVELTAHPPSSGQWALFSDRSQQGGAQSVRAILDLFRYCLDSDDYAVIEESLEEGADVALLSEIARDLMEEWSKRPTKRSTGSSGSGGTTVKRSTAKSRSKSAST